MDYKLYPNLSQLENGELVSDISVDGSENRRPPSNRYARFGTRFKSTRLDGNDLEIER